MGQGVQGLWQPCCASFPAGQGRAQGRAGQGKGGGKERVLRLGTGCTSAQDAPGQKGGESGRQGKGQVTARQTARQGPEMATGAVLRGGVVLVPAML